ncbi:endonuclease/exonuclease/phosphatase family protein, partial [Haloferula sp.]|uniref:endonuclease/exonuclease/phosphatase family protein n=1 Tax=Haloferula sp. TaxID=2497595 RepID=UPI003C70F2DB
MLLLRHLRLFLLGLHVLLSASCLSVEDLSSMVSPPGETVRKVPVSGSVSHFICWNVHKADHENFKQDIGNLLAKVPKDNGLTLCLQEVRCTTFDLIRGLKPDGVNGHYAPSWRLPFSRGSTGVLTIGNQPLPESGVIPIRAPRREFYVASPKVSLKTETRLPDGRILQIVNCHGLNFVPFSVLPKQLDQIFEALECTDSPAIVCGDFNVWSQDRLDLLDQRAAEAGLVEARPRGLEHSPAPKWLRWMNRFNGYDPDIRLDRIYTRGLEVIDCYS